jgi:Skp family chaperone for outer membrane proteins
MESIRKSLIYLLFASVSFILLCFFWQHNQHNSVPKDKEFAYARVAVLDGNRLKKSAKCFKVHEKINDDLTNVLGEIRKFESEARKQHNKFHNDKKLSQEQKTREISRLEAKWAQISVKYASKIQSIKEIENTLTKLIQGKINYVLNTIAKSFRLDIIINKEVHDSVIIFYNSNKIDITDIVIQELDKILPDIDLKKISK